MWYYADMNGGEATHPVGRKEANDWGLRDMHGNVWELCSDWDGAYPTGSAIDPTGPASGGNRVGRGGSSWSDPQDNRSAIRGSVNPHVRNWICGFRLCAFQDGK